MASFFRYFGFILLQKNYNNIALSKYGNRTDKHNKTLKIKDKL